MHVHAIIELYSDAGEHIGTRYVTDPAQVQKTEARLLRAYPASVSVVTYPELATDKAMASVLAALDEWSVRNALHALATRVWLRSVL